MWCQLISDPWVTMELRSTYQMYPADNKSAEDDHRFSLSRICSWLYLYTIGSCRYFHTSLSREDRIELRMLWQSQSDTPDTKEDHWKKKTRKADCQMRKRIRYHFKDHIRKWRDTERPRFPWKMVLHFLLVVVVTVQVRWWYWYYCTYTHIYNTSTCIP